MALAKVVAVDADGRVDIRVRRASRVERLYQRNTDLRIGDWVEVRRRPNNPYPILVDVDPESVTC